MLTDRSAKNRIEQTRTVIVGKGKCSESEAAWKNDNHMRVSCKAMMYNYLIRKIKNSA